MRLFPIGGKSTLRIVFFKYALIVTAQTHKTEFTKIAACNFASGKTRSDRKLKIRSIGKLKPVQFYGKDLHMLKLKSLNPSIKKSRCFHREENARKRKVAQSRCFPRRGLSLSAILQRSCRKVIV